MNVMLQKINI